jgi:hypothetical protein
MNKSKSTFRCPACIDRKGGCPFRDRTFGVVGFPTLLATEEGNRRRAKQNVQKRKSVQSLKERGLGTASTGRTRGASTRKLVVPSISIRSHSEGSVPASETFATFSENKAPQPNTSIFSSPGLPFRVIGHEERVFLYDAGQMAQILTDPARTAEALLAAIAKVRSLASREESEASSLLQQVEDRRLIWEQLTAKLEGALEAMAGGSGSGLVDSSTQVEVEPEKSSDQMVVDEETEIVEEETGGNDDTESGNVEEVVKRVEETQIE